MKMIRTPSLWGMLALCSAHLGCIGTDYIDGPPPAAGQASITVTPDVQVLTPAGDATLAATFTDATGQIVPNAEFHWVSSDATVATVGTLTGIVNAVDPGQAVITVTAPVLAPDLAGATALVTVVASTAAVARVQVSPPVADLLVDDTVQFSAEVRNAIGELLEGQATTWTSSDPSVVTIDDAGAARCVGIGDAEITATVDGVRSVAAMVHVTSPTAGRTGTFVPSRSYRGTGTATLRPQGAGLVLEFSDDFSVSNGPDLRVYLSSANALRPDSVMLGNLQSASGAQTYSVPDTVALGDFGWVLIHCAPFNVTFSRAELE